MGVWIDLYIAPASRPNLSFGCFKDMLLELLEEQMISTPFAVIKGAVDLSTPLGMANIARGIEKSGSQILSSGSSQAELETALKRSPFGNIDICVWFSGLGNNAQLWDELAERGANYNAGVVIYALTNAQSVLLVNHYDETWAEHHFSNCFTLTGKSGPCDVRGTVLEKLLMKHYGPLVVDYSTS